MAGKAKIMSKDVTSVIHVNTGMRIIFIPGARMLIIVTVKFIAAVSDAIPRIWRPIIQKSVPAPVNLIPVIGA